MKFLVKLTDATDPSKVTTVEENAANAKELIEMYKILGQKAEILQEYGNPAPSPLENPTLSKSEVPVVQQTKPTMTQNQIFVDGDKQFKFENGQLYKKEWIDIDTKDYRIYENPKTKKQTIQKLDWVPLTTNEEKDI